MCNSYKTLDDIVISHNDILYTFRSLLDKISKKETIGYELLRVLTSAIEENSKRYETLLTEIKKNVDKGALPYETITKIPNTQPDVIPELWNNSYREIDANFQFIKNYLSKLEEKIGKDVDKKTLPYETITKIPYNRPDAIPELWNKTFREIDFNFQTIKHYLANLEAKIGKKVNLKALPYEEISKIPVADSTDGVPGLWNTPYSEIDANFQFIKNYLEKLEKKIDNS